MLLYVLGVVLSPDSGFFHTLAVGFFQTALNGVVGGVGIVAG